MRDVWDLLCFFFWLMFGPLWRLLGCFFGVWSRGFSPQVPRDSVTVIESQSRLGPGSTGPSASSTGCQVCLTQFGDG